MMQNKFCCHKKGRIAFYSSLRQYALILGLFTIVLFFVASVGWLFTSELVSASVYQMVCIQGERIKRGTFHEASYMYMTCLIGSKLCDTLSVMIESYVVFNDC